MFPLIVLPVSCLGQLVCSLTTYEGYTYVAPVPVPCSFRIETFCSFATVNIRKYHLHRSNRLDYSRQDLPSADGFSFCTKPNFFVFGFSPGNEATFWTIDIRYWEDFFRATFLILSIKMSWKTATGCLKVSLTEAFKDLQRYYYRTVHGEDVLRAGDKQVLRDRVSGGWVVLTIEWRRARISCNENQ